MSQLPEVAPQPQEASLRIAVASILSPEGTIHSYQPFLRYLEEKTGKSVLLIQRRTYKEVNDLLARNVVDAAFVCTGAFSLGKTDMELLVVPQIEGKTTYRSLLIVPASAKTENLEALRGRIFAFTDPLSNSGYLYPLSLLKKQGQSPENFFGRIIFTYSHDRSIAAVMEGVADGAAVDSVIYDYFKQRDPEVAAKSRVILRSGEFGMPPVVVPLRLAREKKEQLKAIFLTTHTEEQGRKALSVMGVDRFVEPDPERYRCGDHDPC
ncbi:substrate-binding domain-containing protein [Thiovibrio sp. JS02]